jgi:hypothetical protein
MTMTNSWRPVSTTSAGASVFRGLTRRLGRLRLRRGLADARRHADRELAGRHVLRDHGTRAGPRALADLARSDDHRVDADERTVVDRRRVLALPS